MLISPHDSATTAMLSRASITVEHMIHSDFVCFRDEQPLAEVRAMAGASNFQAFPVLDEKGRTVGILSKSDFLRKVERKLILVGGTLTTRVSMTSRTLGETSATNLRAGTLKTSRTKSIRSLVSPQRAATASGMPVRRLNSAYPIAEQMESVSGFRCPITRISLIPQRPLPERDYPPCRSSVLPAGKSAGEQLIRKKRRGKD